MGVLLIATLDTKAEEICHVRNCLQASGVDTVLLDASCIGELPAGVVAEIPREQVFRAAGTSLEAMREQGDRGVAMTRAAAGAAAEALRLHAAGELAGVLAIGGGGGTSVGTAAMRALPLGVPKLMVSTVASGDVRAFVGDRDILMMNSVVDLLGLNRISRVVLGQAAAAMAGLVKSRQPDEVRQDRPLVAATMFGVTTPCVERARQVLDEAGYEVLVFHATGSGGMTMENLVREGLIAGVLDITTTELADELVGGVLSAGPTRLTAAGEGGVPQVISVGATDMVNFWGKETVPPEFQTRKLHVHNANVTLMRTTAAECQQIGAEIGRRASAATGPTAVLLPTRGVSALDCEGQAFDDPAARQALLSALEQAAAGVDVVRIDRHLNDPEFAEAAARRLIGMMEAG